MGRVHLHMISLLGAFACFSLALVRSFAADFVLFARIVRADRVMDQRDKAAPAIAVIYQGPGWVHLYKLPSVCAGEMPLWV